MNNQKKVASFNQENKQLENKFNSETPLLKKKKFLSNNFSKEKILNTEINIKTRNKPNLYMLKSSYSMSNLMKKPSIQIKSINKFSINKPHIILNPLDIMKKRVKIILKETNLKLIDLSLSMTQIDIDDHDSYKKIQIEYMEELDSIYKEKFNKIREIKSKYDYDVFELQKIYKNDYKDLIHELKEEKDNIISAVQDDFIIKKNLAKKKFQDKIKEIQENSSYERNNLLERDIFNEMKEKITKILNKPIVNFEFPNHKQNKNNNINNKILSIKAN